MYPRCEAHRREFKSEYDKKYAKKNKLAIKERKAAYFQRVYKANPEKFREIRQKRMPKHIEYCRNPEYKKKKKQYDAISRHGEFRECYELMEEIFTIARNHYDSEYERYKARGYYERKKEYLKLWRKRRYAATGR